jgi:trigger factor
MQSQVEQLTPVLVQVAVEVPWSKVNEGLEGAYRNVQRTAKVRGFRQGKVPRNVVKSMMGKAIEREVALRLVEEGLQEAVSKHSLEPVSMADMGDTPALTQGEPMRFSVKLEVRPKIESVDTSALAVERRIDLVSDASRTPSCARPIRCAQPRPATCSACRSRSRSTVRRVPT